MPSRTRRQAAAEATATPEENSSGASSSEEHHKSQSPQGTDLSGRMDDFQPPRSQLARSPSQPQPVLSAQVGASSALAQSPPSSWQGSVPPHQTKQQQPRRSPPYFGLTNDQLDNVDVFTLPLGSFTEDSPPRPASLGPESRGNSIESFDVLGRRRSPRSSPIGQAKPTSLYRASTYQRKPPAVPPQAHYQPRPGQPAQARPPVHMTGNVPPMYYASRSGGAPYAYFPGPPQQQHYAQAPPPPALDHDWNSPPPLDEASHRTPEKRQDNPFRSPSAVEKKGSPLFQASPNISGCGSFGMIDTPGGTLAGDFSPMGPAFAGLTGESGSVPSRSSSAERAGGPVMPPPMPSMLAPEQSPFGFFNNSFSPFGLQGVSRSPVQSGSQDRTRRMAPSSHQLQDRSRQFLDTALSPPSKKTVVRARSAPDAKPRKLWQDPTNVSSATGAIMLELGSRPLSVQRSLEGINSMMRSQAMPHYPTVVGRPPYVHGMPHHLHHHQRQLHVQHAGYQRPMNTPLKTAGGTQSGDTAHAQPTPAPSSAKQQTHGLVQAKVPSTQKTQTSGKENSTALTAASATPAPLGRRVPCNCKKSKCLKLYCECFSQELVCEGCKCSDCNNTNEFAAIREKAMKEIRSKNPKAFQARITSRPGGGGPIDQGQHSMGCRCKKSECLKKYCECFQAGILCGTECKCAGCMNRPGSQKLIDKRRKMNDKKGAEYAMKVAEETWKGSGHQQRQQPQHPPPNPAVASSHRVPMPSPAAMGGMSSMMQPSPASASGARGRPGMPSQYIRYPFMGPPHMGYPTMGGMPPVTPGYGDPRMGGGHARFIRAPDPGSSRQVPDTTTSSRTTLKRAASKITPGTSTPCTPGIRVAFDPAFSRKKRNTGGAEQVFPVFGPQLPDQPKTTALTVFSFLSDMELYNAAQVCKLWKLLATDKELWRHD